MKNQILTFGDLSLDTTAMLAYRGDKPIVLTKTEYDLLYVFMSHPNQALSELQIYAMWRPSIKKKNSNLLSVYMNYLRKKVDNPESPILHTMYGHGYIMRKSIQ